MSEAEEPDVFSLVRRTLGEAVQVAARGTPPPCGPAASAWLSRLAAALRDHSGAWGALSAPGGRASLHLEGAAAGLRLEWREWGGPEGQLGLPALPDGAPEGLRLRRPVQSGTLVLALELPAASLAA